MFSKAPFEARFDRYEEGNIMKKKFVTALIVSAMAVTALFGCGNKAEEAPAEQAPAEEISVEAEAEETPTQEPVEEEAPLEENEPARPTSLDDALALAVLEYNSEFFTDGEVSGEGHIMMDSDETDGEVKCYCLTVFGRYEFQDGNFVRCAGNGVIPTVITLSLNDEGEYSLVSFKEAEDGSEFVPSIKENFPEALWSRCITIEDDDRNELDRQERAYAEEYLSQIGREDVEIGEYADFEHKIFSDFGVSDDVSNALLDVESGDLDNKYPMWIGEREVLEDGVRIIYRKELNEKEKEVTYSKIDYESGEVLESTVYSTKTGEKAE